VDNYSLADRLGYRSYAHQSIFKSLFIKSIRDELYANVEHRNGIKHKGLKNYKNRSSRFANRHSSIDRSMYYNLIKIWVICQALSAYRSMYYKLIKILIICQASSIDRIEQQKGLKIHTNRSDRSDRSIHNTKTHVLLFSTTI
jgi:hypothetical protein